MFSRKKLSSRAVADDGGVSDFVDNNSDDHVDSEDSDSIVEEGSFASDANSYSLDDDGSTSNYDSDDGKIRDDDANRLCYRLATNALTELDIDLSCIVSVARDIAELLPSNSSLKKLALVFNPSHLEAAEARYQSNVLTILCSGIAANSYIVDIQVRNADLDGEVAFLLGATFAQNQSVQKICLKDCNLIDSGFAVLFLGMQRNQQIQELAILSCDLSNYNSDVVAASLPLMALKSLTLDNTNLTLEGVRFLCDRIKNSPDLLQLSLSGNALGRRGMKYLISCLKCQHTKWEKLDLSGCGLDDACVKHLAGCLSHNSTLFHLNLSDNDFGNDGATFLKMLLNDNHSIKELFVDGCRISKRRQILIDDGLRYNNTFLKSLFSESVSLAILDSVEVIDNLGVNV